MNTDDMEDEHIEYKKCPFCLACDIPVYEQLCDECNHRHQLEDKEEDEI